MDFRFEFIFTNSDELCHYLTDNQGERMLIAKMFDYAGYKTYSLTLPTTSNTYHLGNA